MNERVERWYSSYLRSSWGFCVERIAERSVRGLYDAEVIATAAVVGRREGNVTCNVELGRLIGRITRTLPSIPELVRA